MKDVKRSPLYSQFKTDQTVEAEGVWARDVVPGVHVKVARRTSPKYREVVRRLQRPLQAQIDRGTLSPEQDTELLVRAMAEATITDWEGVTDEDGNALEPTLPNKMKVLRELPDFRSYVFELSRTLEVYRAEALEEAAKNSSPSSTGSSSGGRSPKPGAGSTTAE